MNRHTRIALVCLGTLASANALAAPLPFSASWAGTSQIVEDIVNMATGAGTGTNVFTASGGDQLFGSFSVQIVPTDVPGSV